MAGSQTTGETTTTITVTLGKQHEMPNEEAMGCAHVAKPGTRGRRQNASSVKPVGTGVSHKESQ